jgi:Spy/CpxP family protein refolding chaperone
MRKTILTAIPVAFLMVATMAFAQPGQGRPGRGNGPGGGAKAGPIEFLGLDEAQTEAWNAFHEEFRAAVEPIHEARQALQVQLREALDAETANATAIGQLMIDAQKLRAEVVALRDQLDENLKSILTPDQLAKFEAFRAARTHTRGARGPGKGFGAGNGPGNGFGAGPGLGNCDGPRR